MYSELVACYTVQLHYEATFLLTFHQYTSRQLRSRGKTIRTHQACRLGCLPLKLNCIAERKMASKVHFSCEVSTQPPTARNKSVSYARQVEGFVAAYYSYRKMMQQTEFFVAWIFCVIFLTAGPCSDLWLPNEEKASNLDTRDE